MKLKFEYFKTPHYGWYWHIRARNGKIIANGEGYKNKAGVLKVLKVLNGAQLTAIHTPL